MPIVVRLLALTTALAATSPARAQCETDTILPGLPFSFYVDDLDIDGDHVAVTFGSRDRILIYRRVGDSLLLESAAGADVSVCLNASFSGVALDGSLLIVRDDGGGSFPCFLDRLHFFQRSGATWNLTQTITGTDNTPTQDIGNNLALQGDILIATAPFADVAGKSNAGAVHVLANSAGSWTIVQTLTDPVPAANAQFGRGMAMRNDVLAVGASGGSSGPNFPVYLYHRTGNIWTFDELIHPTGAGPGNTDFGSAIAIDDTATRLAVGAPTALGTGAVFIFEQLGESWAQTAIIPGDPRLAGSFGASLDFSPDGTLLLVGDPDAADVGFGFGAVRLYELIGGEWTLVSSFSHLPAGCYGRQIALGDGWAAAADPCFQNFTLISGIGPAAEDCNANGEPDPCDIASGASADADGDAIPDECDPDADLDDNGLINGADLGLLLAQWGDCRRCTADLNHDRAVDGADLGLLLSAWTIPPPACGTGDCCAEHDLPGCADSTCCIIICAVDPFCCDVGWDHVCVERAEDDCGCPAASACADAPADCCMPHDTVGCDDPECCEVICELIDPACCAIQWDQYCADFALHFCGSCTVVPFCNASAMWSCCAEGQTWGCENQECCAIVCAVDPFCCCVTWDQLCADQAILLCEVCE